MPRIDRSAVGLVATVLAAVAITSVAALRGQVTQTSGSPSSEQDLVWAADRWAAFTADVENWAPSGTVRGRIAQSGNGSRYRAMLDNGGHPMQVAAYNTQTARAYKMEGNGQGWTVQPLEFDSEPSRTAINVTRTVPLSADDPRVAKLEAARYGIRFFIQRSAAGVLNIISPELNVRSVYYESGRGSGERWVSLTMGEPPPALFNPPVGVPLRELADVVKLGTVSRRPSAATQR